MRRTVAVYDPENPNLKLGDWPAHLAGAGVHDMDDDDLITVARIALVAQGLITADQAHLARFVVEEGG